MNEINDPISAPIEEQIAQLTAWPVEAESDIWRSALEITKRKKRKSPNLALQFLKWPIPKALAAVILVVLIGAVLAAMFDIGRARQQAQSSRADSNLKQLGAAMSTYAAKWTNRQFSILPSLGGSIIGK